MNSNKYWIKRLQQIEKISEEELLHQIEIIYKDLWNKTERDLNKLLRDWRQDANIDYFHYDRYWNLLNNLDANLIELGNKEDRILSNNLTNHYKEVREYLDNKKSDYSKINPLRAEAVAKEVWCFDGKNYSSRIWTNVEKLKASIKSGLEACVVRGDSPEQWKNELMRSFGVSYSRANTLVRTELKHCNTQAQIDWARENNFDSFTYHTADDSKVCSPECENCNGKKFKLINAAYGLNIPPLHPNCRCYITFN